MFEYAPDTRTLRRFLRKLDNYPDESKCWNWTSNQNWRGYGTFTYANKNWLAHRISYLFEYGELTPGREIDHLCRNTSCSNPLHLEEVDHPTNTIRGNHNGKKTHCKRGHLFDESNTYHGMGSNLHPSRRCRTCKRLRHRGEL